MTTDREQQRNHGHLSHLAMQCMEIARNWKCVWEEEQRNPTGRPDIDMIPVRIRNNVMRAREANRQAVRLWWRRS